MIRNLIKRAQFRFWRTVHLIFNVLAWRFASAQVFDEVLRQHSVLWRINDFAADKYMPALNQTAIIEGIAAELGLGVTYDDQGQAIGFVEVSSDEDPDRVPTIPDVEEEKTAKLAVNEEVIAAYEDSPNYKVTRTG